MVAIKYQSRLGNRLFQYAFARVVAEELGYSLSAGTLAGFPGTTDVVHGKVFHSPHIVYNEWDCILKRIILDKSDRHIQIEGFAQRIEYFIGRESLIRGWLRHGEISRMPNLHPDDIVIHVRLGDYRDVYRSSIPDFKSYFEPILSSLRFRRIFLCAEDFTDCYLDQFKQFDCVLFKGEAVDVIRLMQRSRRMITSQSTLSWWGAFLSEAEEIYVPQIPHSLWSPGHLDVPDSRYIYWPCLSIIDTWMDRQEGLSFGSPKRFMSQKFRPDLGAPVI